MIEGVPRGQCARLLVPPDEGSSEETLTSELGPVRERVAERLRSSFRSISLHLRRLHGARRAEQMFEAPR